MKDEFIFNPYSRGFCTDDSVFEDEKYLSLLRKAPKKEKTETTKQAEIMRSEQLARRIYCTVNTIGSRRVSIEACRNAAENYYDIYDFANYGLDGFAKKYKLTKAQVGGISSYADAAEEKKYHMYDGAQLRTWKDAAYFFYDKFENEHVECAYIVYVDENMRVAGSHKIVGYTTNVHVEPYDIRRYRPYADRVGYFLAHNHVNAGVRPSRDDISMTMLFDYVMNKPHTTLLDSFAVNGNRVFSIMHNKVVYIDKDLDLFSANDN